MTELLYEWMKNLVFYFVLASMIMNVIPDSKYQKYIRFFLGMLLIVIVITPILELFNLADTMDENYYKNSIQSSWDETVGDVEQEMEIGQ